MEKEFIKYGIPSLHIKVSTFNMDLGYEYKKEHIHNAAEIVYVNEGKILCHINNENIVINAESAVLISGHTIHYIESIGRANVTIIQIDINKIANMVLNKNVSYICEFILKAQSRRFYIAQNGDELLQLTLKIKSEFDTKSKYYDLYIKAYLFQLTAFMLRNKLLIEENHSTINELTELLPAIEYINQNYNRKLFLDEICDLVSYNKYYMCRVFKELTGGTVFEYINYVRLRKAEELICNTSKSVSEIAFECGFASIQYFNRVFKKQTGYSPRSFKKVM